jgi:hypothetical protein
MSSFIGVTKTKKEKIYNNRSGKFKDRVKQNNPPKTKPTIKEIKW